ncbi:hypothetical protein GO730_36900 [Spirosoma sp. HMF3257]|uniref:Uncharacterized protein n=1 Tax=Spirosoma telluris TaxID=2183553 RepID=A0A327NWK2_9BACT|nr:hypothetical protein [Spirosoma telluris]RAI78254.1 hypothetical protein HMF3257_36830 [Spirosoma telluris]
MRLFIFLLGFAVSVHSAFSQIQPETMSQATRDRINTTNMIISNNLTLLTVKGPPGQLIGDPYLDTTWQAGNVKFYNRLGVSLTTDSLAGVPVRLDLSANEIEVKAGATDIRAVKATAIRYVDINNSFGSASRYMNVHEYQGDTESLKGFFEQVVTGKLDLLLYPSVYIQKANFNMALNTGNKDDELVKKMDWYVARNKKATKFSPGRKAILELMADKKEQLDAFLKTEKPDLKSRSGLIAVFSYYNRP